MSVHCSASTPSSSWCRGAVARGSSPSSTPPQAASRLSRPRAYRDCRTRDTVPSPFATSTATPGFTDTVAYVPGFVHPGG